MIRLKEKKKAKKHLMEIKKNVWKEKQQENIINKN
jgi:hypothetical protein